LFVSIRLRCANSYDCGFLVVPPWFEHPADPHSSRHRPDGLSNDTSEAVIGGEPVRLRCMVNGIPRPRVTWYKNGAELRLDADDKHLLSRDGRELSIKSASLEDTARYTCVATNVAGETRRNFNVDVLGLTSLIIYV